MPPESTMASATLPWNTSGVAPAGAGRRRSVAPTATRAATAGRRRFISTSRVAVAIAPLGGRDRVAKRFGDEGQQIGSGPEDDRLAAHDMLDTPVELPICRVDCVV